MGGLGPGIGGFEILVIGLVALLVVGPKDLPVLMRKVGQFVAKARGMANEFRASFDEMARQSELDDLRKEVEALRTGQGMYPLGADAEAAFKDIRKDLEAPLDAPAPAAPAVAAPVATGVDEWPDAFRAEPAAAAAIVAEPAVKAPSKPKAARAPTKTAGKTAAKASPAKVAASTTTAPAKPKAVRKKKVDQ